MKKRIPKYQFAGSNPCGDGTKWDAKLKQCVPMTPQDYMWGDGSNTTVPKPSGIDTPIPVTPGIEPAKNQPRGATTDSSGKVIPGTIHPIKRDENGNIVVTTDDRTDKTGKKIRYEDAIGDAIDQGFTLDSDGKYRKKVISKDPNNLGYSNFFKGLNTIMDITQFFAGNINDAKVKRAEKEKLMKASYPRPQINPYEGGLNNVPVYVRTGGNVSAKKAREILHDGTVHGRPITEQQRKYFGAIASGYIKEQGGEIPKYQFAGAYQPTRGDSIIILKNALAKDAFYRNNPDYTAGKLKDMLLGDASSFISKEALKKLQDQSIDYHNQASTAPQLFNRKETHFNFSAKDLLQKTGKVKGSNIIYAVPDNIRPGEIDTYYNPSSPAVFFSPYILPQGVRSYFSSNLRDISVSPQYDPLAVTPWDMLTPAQQQERLKKYGTSGTPYNKTNKPQPSNKQSKPQPPVKKNTGHELVQEITPKPKPQLTHGVDHINPITQNHILQLARNIIPRQTENVDVPQIQDRPYRVDYIGEDGKPAHSYFPSQAEGEGFMKMIQDRPMGISGNPPGGSVEGYYERIPKKLTGGWLDKYGQQKTPTYQKGGEYDMSEEEIQNLINQGYKIQYL